MLASLVGDGASVRKSPSIGLLVLGSAADDPRVRRQGDAFAAAGWRVEAFALPGARAQAPAWPVTTLSDAEAAGGPGGMRETTSVRIRRRLAKILGLAGLQLGALAWPRIYWRLDSRFRALLALASPRRRDIWLANDWQMLPIALELARRQGSIVVYDTHELASNEYSDNPRWRLLHRPLVMAVEGACIGDAALVTCVSAGIAAELQREYTLATTPTVIRNIPAMTRVGSRPTGRPVRVLYHGVVSPGRGLEACIRSVPQWRDGYTLTIRGPAQPDYREVLEREILAAGVADRVTLAEPVPVTELVREAAAFDIGLFCLPGSSLQNRLALPNKLFEYTMAGLALCVSALPEMATMVREHELGVLIEGDTPEAVAAAINSLDATALDRYRTNSLKAGKSLNWESEGSRLVDACTALLHGIVPSADP
ncbi:glycosyltransferase [Bosea vestrisii]|uniref:glycosyltransferase n=1 Tax=Bosea vestrisii TaxID=151416 RepID=UPI0024DFA831|nr:glycosyltransferase [Bosea vestrisii]WID98751.1 glycosyltransferase [Bosea vestrisii]